MINAISIFFAERVEPLIFSFRRRKRLQEFGVDDVRVLPSVPVAFGDPCTRGRLCERLIRLYQRYYARYVQRASDGSLIQRGGVAAVLALGEFPDFVAYRAAVGKKASFFARKAKKAAQMGYSVAEFNRANHTPDLLALRKSMKFRAFGPVLDAFFLTLKGMGGAPAKLRPLKPVDCRTHWEVCLGVFEDCPGYRQGTVTVDRRLVAYVRLHRVGNLVRFADFMGHREHLPSGVMMLLQMEIVRWLMRDDDPAVAGISHVTYGAIEQGSAGLLFWKRKALFRPVLFELPG